MSYPATRAYAVRVTDREQLSEHFVRFTFTGEEIQHFGTHGLDQRIKLLFPHADGSFTDTGLFDEPRPQMADWHKRWRLLEEEERNPMRTYTIRAVRPEQSEIDVDVVLHGIHGPASAWAAAAQLGEELIILGPDARSQAPDIGIDWKPGEATDLLLVGDETAAPAICAILESLAEAERSGEMAYTGHAVIEVPSEDDVLSFEKSTPKGIQVTWLARNGAEHGEKLTCTVQQLATSFFGLTDGSVDADDLDEDENALLWDVPDPEGVAQRYAWLAGEAGVITGLRRHFVKDLGVDRKTIAFMGYWRAGRAEGA